MLGINIAIHTTTEKNVGQRPLNICVHGSITSVEAFPGFTKSLLGSQKYFRFSNFFLGKYYPDIFFSKADPCFTGHMPQSACVTVSPFGDLLMHPEKTILDTTAAQH